ncbi:MAG: MarR family transcriptional regulator [Gammaproteobacteria bacterium]
MIAERHEKAYIRYSQITNDTMKRKLTQQVALKPQDLMVLMKLLAMGGKPATYAELAEALGMSASEVHASIGRARSARLVTLESDRPAVVRAALKEFLLHGAKYAFPATLGSPTRGLPTAYAAPPLVTRVSQPSEPPPVWPDPEGERRGVSFFPLYPTAPLAARKDRVLYEFLALFDALRGGAARERQLADQILSERLA